MTYPFIQAQYHGDPGSFRELRAVTVHMAEGGGTVSWLTHPSNANSSHFVIEYSGRIVQMVRDDEYDFSLHVARPAGPPGPGDFGIYSLDVAKAVLGDGIGDPNRYMYAVELEGFAAVGPNGDQARALGVLVSDLRGRYPSMRGLLGHRDFQSYKPCPGGSIPWAQIGGHGLFGAAPQQGVTAMSYALRVREFDTPKTFTLAPGKVLSFYDPDRPGKPVYNAVFPMEFTGTVTGTASVNWRNLGNSPRPIPDSGGGFNFSEVGDVTPYPAGGVAIDTYRGLLIVTATDGLTVAP